MADVKLPNISQANLNVNGQSAGVADAQAVYASENAANRTDGRSQSFHSGRGNGFGQVGRSIMEAKKQRKE